MVLYRLFVRRHEVAGGPVAEPTRLALLLSAAAVGAAGAVCLAAMAALPTLGHAGAAAGLLAAVLAWLRAGLLRSADAAAGRQRLYRRGLRLARWGFVGLLACWLGLIAWAGLSPGGPPPPPKADPAHIRVMTWNVKCGQDAGPPWRQFDWPARKAALRSAVEQAAPDVLCVQEALPEQVAYLERALPDHHRVGEGRDGDGRGEHCAVYFRRGRFDHLGDGTFWLDAASGPVAARFEPPRICTWVRLRDRVSGRTFRVYNTHLHLTEGARRQAVRHLLDQVAAAAPADAVLLTADFNATPAAPSRRLLDEAGLTDSAAPLGRGGEPTLHLYGVGVRSIDAVLVDHRWRVHAHRVLDVKPGGVLPSDHFGVLADVTLAGRPGAR